MEDVVFRIGVFVPVLLLSVTFHEVAHGYAAYLLGDSTAKNQGRLSLNPIVHIDPTGLVVMIITAYFGFGIGWAKPVPVNPMYFRNPHKGMMITALAGPVANLVIAFVFNLLIRLIIVLEVATPGRIMQMLFAIVFLNLILAAFNLIPIPPMDGSRILAYFLPAQLRHQFYGLDRYGMIFVIVLAISGVLFYVMIPIAYILGRILWIHPAILEVFTFIWSK